jgi:hypothetical protein
MLRTRELRPLPRTRRDGPAIEARGLVMRYGDREVLHGIEEIYLALTSDKEVSLPPSAAAWATFAVVVLLGAAGTDLTKLLAWLVVGLVVAQRTFRWEQAA